MKRYENFHGNTVAGNNPESPTGGPDDDDGMPEICQFNCIGVKGPQTCGMDPEDCQAELDAIQDKGRNADRAEAMAEDARDARRSDRELDAMAEEIRRI